MLSQSRVTCPKRFAGSSILCGVLVLLVQSIGGALPAASVTWSPITDPSVTGYKVEATASTRTATYEQRDCRGQQYHRDAYGPRSGTTYYIAATTYDSAGNESPFERSHLHRAGRRVHPDGPYSGRWPPGLRFPALPAPSTLCRLPPTWLTGFHYKPIPRRSILSTPLPVVSNSVSIGR